MYTCLLPDMSLINNRRQGEQDKAAVASTATSLLPTAFWHQAAGRAGHVKGWGGVVGGKENFAPLSTVGLPRGVGRGVLFDRCEIKAQRQGRHEAHLGQGLGCVG